MTKITIIRRPKGSIGPKVLLKQDMGAPLVPGITPPETEQFETLDEAKSRAKEIGGEVDIIDNSAA
jgi:hypothetical protein